MFHSLAFREPTLGTVANTQLPAVNDDQITRRNGNFFIPENARLQYAYAGSGDADIARILTPDFRVIAPVQIRPVSSAILPASPPGILDYLSDPLPIRKGQEMSVEMTDGTGLTVGIAIIGVSFGFSPAPKGEQYIVRAVGSTTTVAGAWTNCDITYDEDLPPGNYAVVGMSAVGATAVCARLLFSGQNYRPGCVANAAADGLTHPMFTNGKLGSWGVYDNVVPPQVEFLCNAADTAQIIWLQVIKV